MIPDPLEYPRLASLQEATWGSTPMRFVFEQEPPVPELVGNVRCACFSGGRVLVIDTQEFGLSAFPGGMLEVGESWEQALERELIEEAGARTLSVEVVGRLHFSSGADAPYRPHLPHPEFQWVVAFAEGELVRSPTNPPGGERVLSVELLPIHEAVERLRSANPFEAELLSFVAEVRAGYSSSMFGPARHENLATALALEGGERVVDLGCGRGDTLIALAARLGPSARLIGVDKSPSLRGALAGDVRMRAVAADLNGPLPFSGSSFDAAVCHNTLECLTKREIFLEEVRRVLSPGGSFLLGHSDFDTMVISGADLELTRLLVHNYTDTTEAWMDTSNGTMGRNLLVYARRSGLDLVRSFAWVGMHSSLAPGMPAREAVDAVAGAARRNPHLRERVEPWLRDLERADERGELLYSINDYALLLRKT